MPSWNMDDFNLGGDTLGGQSVTTKLPKAKKATPEQEELARPRSPSERFRDAYIAAALHNPLGAEGAMRYLRVNRPKGMTDAQLNRIERRMADEFARKANADPARHGSGIAANYGSALRGGIDLLGGFLGGVDPTVALAPGRTAAARIAAQMGINAGEDALSQGIEMHRGVRDEYDPYETLTNAAAGVVTQGAGEAFRHTRLTRMVNEGSAHPDWKAVNDIIVRDLEGGGTLSRPKTSPKGAKGPQQVMPETARKPGFGINPWDGKSQEDLARVGREYSAAMMSKYNGDPAKVFAAYNAGPGKVDHLIKLHGDNWASFLPDETKVYLHKGLSNLRQGPEDLGESHIVRDEQPSVEEQARVNQRLHPSDELAANLPRLEDSIHYENDAPDVPKEGSSDLRAAVIDTDGNVHVGKPGDIHMNVVRDMIDKGIPEHKWGASGFVDKEGNFLTKGQAGEKYGVSDATLIPEAQDSGNVVDLQNVRENLSNQKTRNLLDEKIESATHHEDAVLHDESPMTLDTARENRVTAEKMHDMLPDDHPYKEKTAYLVDVWRNIEHTIHSRDGAARIGDDPIAENTKVYPATSDYIKGETRLKREVPKANNDVYGQVDDIHKTLHEYTDKEWNKLPKVWQEKLARDANEKVFNPEVPDHPERDTNPPAASSSFGTKRPEGINPRSSATPKAPEGHDDLKSVRTQKKLVLDKLGDILDKSTPIRREAEAAISKERSQRLAKVYAIREKAGGEAGFHKELAALKGAIDRPRINSIRDQFTPQEIDGLYDAINKSPALEGFETIRAKAALKKLLGANYGEVPTASEIALLAKAMPRQASVWKRLLENQEGSIDIPDGAIKSAIIDTLSITRTLKASFDVSAPGRQGVFLIGSKHWWKDQKGMFKALVSEKQFHEINEEIRNRPTYELMNKAGLEITKPAGAASILDREEAFVSKIAEKIPGVRQSERAYLAFLNKLRADVFDDFVKRGERLGIDFVQDPHYLKSAAKFVNAATGRGSVKWMGRNGELLGKALFSPKLMASRLQLLNPVFYAHLHPTVRLQAAKHGLIYAGAVMSILGLAAAAGASVEMDPRSSDFAKMKIGNTRIDFTGGFQPYVRFYAQMIMGQQKGQDGEVRNVGWTPAILRHYFPGVEQSAFKPTTRKDVFYRFLENKEAPNLSEITRLLQGSDGVGNPLTPTSEATNLFAPLIMADTYQAMKDLGPLGILTAIPNAFGAGVSTYTPKAKKPDQVEWDARDFGDGAWSMKDFQ
jgi:hypothetical protein